MADFLRVRRSLQAANEAIVKIRISLDELFDIRSRPDWAALEAGSQTYYGYPVIIDGVGEHVH